MADWDRDHRSPDARMDGGAAGPPGGRPIDRDPRSDRGDGGARQARDSRPASYEQGPAPFEPGGAAARGYGQGGDTAFGQAAGGSSDSGLGGYSGANVGGWGQPNLNSQWGQAGYAPLNQGLDYGQGGGRFGPAGYDTGSFGQAPPRQADRSKPRDEHHVSYQHWRDTQLGSHDRDYARWREEQARRYDEDYGSWRNERHSAFSKEFEGWRVGRGGQAVGPPSAGQGVDPTRPAPPSSDPSAGGEQGYAHGANQTLADIADGHAGKRHTHPDHKAHDPEQD